MQSNAVLPSLGAPVEHELEGDMETVEGYGVLSVDQVASKIVAQVLERVVLGEEGRAELKEAEEGSGRKVSKPSPSHTHMHTPPSPPPAHTPPCTLHTSAHIPLHTDP